MSARPMLRTLAIERLEQTVHQVHQAQSALRAVAQLAGPSHCPNSAVELQREDLEALLTLIGERLGTQVATFDDLAVELRHLDGAGAH